MVTCQILRIIPVYKNLVIYIVHDQIKVAIVIQISISGSIGI